MGSKRRPLLLLTRTVEQSNMILVVVPGAFSLLHVCIPPPPLAPFEGGGVEVVVVGAIVGLSMVVVGSVVGGSFAGGAAYEEEHSHSVGGLASEMSILLMSWIDRAILPWISQKAPDSHTV